MKPPTRSSTSPKTAIGYVRVSTLEQVTEGVSLDAQRDRLRAYCKANGIRLIDIVADEGISGSTLDRPGLQAALRMLRRGRANTLLVVKLDRLSRSLRDMCSLVDDYFADEKLHLLSVCGMVNTHNAAGRMLMMMLANFNQFEREMISERTRESMQHLKSQGVPLGPAPYGYEYANQLDDKGRRQLGPLEAEQKVLAKMVEARVAGAGFKKIAKQLNADKIAARRGGLWSGRVVSVIMQREGKHTVGPRKPYPPRVKLVHDKQAAAERARQLRAEGLSLRDIGLRLRKEGLVPLRGGIWHPATIVELLRYLGADNCDGAAKRAAELRAQGMTLREVGVRLTLEGHKSPGGGAWYASRVHALLASQGAVEDSCDANDLSESL